MTKLEKVTPTIESLRTTQIAFFRFATSSGFLGGRRQGTKSIRARILARQNHMKPLVRTSFLGTRPSCLPSPGRPLFCTDDRKPNLRLGLPGSPVKNSVKHYNCLIWRLKWLLIIMVSLFWRETNSHYWCKKNDLWKANVAKKKFKIVPNILRYGITTEQRLRSLFLTKHLQDEIRCFRNSEWKVAEAWGLKFRCVSADGLDGKRVR